MITFGSDPEFMLVDKKGNLKSAIGVINGTKEKRLKIGEHQAYYDNVLSEVSIKPAASAKEAVSNFKDCFSRLAKLVNPLRLKILASAVYPDSECQHADAKEFGCHEDYCAYRMAVIAPPNVPANGFRSAGGHIHIGFDGGVGEDDDVVWNRVWVVRAMDLFFGLPSLLLDNSEASVNRRKLYGKAGAHRSCVAYGVEYRSLSNFWLASPKLVELAFDISNFAVKFAIEDKVLETIWDKEYNSMDLFNTMSSVDVKQAAKNVKTVESKYMPLIKKYLPNNLMNRLQTEIESKNQYDFYKEWNIE